MLTVELRSLENEEVVVQEQGLAQVLGLDLAPELSSEPLEVFCQVSKVEELFVAKGWVKGVMLLTCDRCLEAFVSSYKSFFEMHYRLQTDEVKQDD